MLSKHDVSPYLCVILPELCVGLRSSGGAIRLLTPSSSTGSSLEYGFFFCITSSGGFFGAEKIYRQLLYMAGVYQSEQTVSSECIGVNPHLNCPTFPHLNCPELDLG